MSYLGEDTKSRWYISKVRVVGRKVSQDGVGDLG